MCSEGLRGPSKGRICRPAHDHNLCIDWNSLTVILFWKEQQSGLTNWVMVDRFLYVWSRSVAKRHIISKLLTPCRGRPRAKQWTSESSGANAAMLFEVSVVLVEKDTGCKVHESFFFSSFFGEERSSLLSAIFFVMLRWHLVQLAYIWDLVIFLIWWHMGHGI